eukprot:maker-scaffold222_size251774-snap-gene-1.30 protein:Tk11451 transcript:maker-scaffold222_size251774-snap-gene-1.30-mRNA-1 annotation:"p-loop containing nucleoside triphosphate hydrolase domain-containing protein"
MITKREQTGWRSGRGSWFIVFVLNSIMEDYLNVRTCKKIFKNTWRQCWVVLERFTLDIQDAEAKTTIGSYDLSELVSVVLNDKKYLVVRTKQGQKLEFKDPNLEVITRWKNQILKSKKESLQLDLTVTDSSGYEFHNRTMSIKSSVSYKPRKISQSGSVHFSPNDQLLGPSLLSSKRKSVSMGTLPKFEIWSDSHSNASNDSKFSTIRSRTGSRSSRMRRPVIPIHTQNLRVFQGLGSHSTEHIDVVHIEPALDTISSSGQYPLVSPDGFISKSPISTSASDQGLDSGRSENGPAAIKPPLAKGKSSKKSSKDSIMRSTSGSITHAFQRLSFNRGQSVPSEHKTLRESRKLMISSPTNPRPLREDKRMSLAFAETPLVEVLPMRPHSHGKSKASGQPGMEDRIDEPDTYTKSLKRKGSKRLVERVKSLPRSILWRTSSGPSKDDKGEPKLEQSGQVKPKLIKQESLVNPENDELQGKLKKWKHSADTSNPVSPAGHPVSKPPLPAKSLSFKKRQLKNLLDGKIDPPPNKRWPKYAIMELYDKVSFEMKAVQRNQDRDELNKMYDEPRQINWSDV